MEREGRGRRGGKGKEGKGEGKGTPERSPPSKFVSTPLITCRTYLETVLL